VEQPQEVIRTQLQALEQVLSSSSEVTERAQHVVAAIQKSADPFRQTFG
jgi:serine/threonine-protein kinase HipA